MNEPLHIGARVPTSGGLPQQLGIARMAAQLEAAGFESLWIMDHIVLPREIRSRYPFAEDGHVNWPVEADHIEPIVAMSAIATATSTAELGTAVLILPMRNPILLAKQAACIDVISGGRLVLGVGAGWLREEFEALGSDFDARGAVLDEWLSIARRCWTGTVEPFEGRYYRLPQAIYSRPTPLRRLPVLIGGMSRHALQRAGRVADGWLAAYSLENLSQTGVAEGLEMIRQAGRESGRTKADLDRMRVVVRVTGVARRLDLLASRLGSLADAGATEVIVDVDWADLDGPSRAFNTLRSSFT